MEKSLPSAVFSPDDFVLGKRAVQVYSYNYAESLPDEVKVKLASLMHRLNRLDYGNEGPR